MIAAKDIVGAWRLVAFKLTDSAGGEVYPWTEDSAGYLFYSPDGHMCALITALVKKPGGGTEPLTMGYAGPFECRGDHVLHHVRVSSQHDLVGTSQRRDAVLDGDRLTLRSTPSLFGGPGSKAELFWRRA